MAHLWEETSGEFIGDPDSARATPSHSGMHEWTGRPARPAASVIYVSENIRPDGSSSTTFEASGSSRLNPEAPDFVPLAKAARSTKRRASSLMKPSKIPTGLSGHRFGYGHPDVDANGDYSSFSIFRRKRAPYIRTTDVFGPDNDAELRTPNGGYGPIQQSEGRSSYVHDPLLPRLFTTIGQDGHGRASCPSNELPPLLTEPCSAILISRCELPSFSSSGSVCLKYLPLCPDGTCYGPGKRLTIEPGCRRQIEQASLKGTGSCQITWPADSLPVEIFDLITYHLSRDDVAAMRLVNHDFERKVARSLFHTSVIPFNTELYDMIQNFPQPNSAISDSTNKTSLHWQNTKEDKDGKLYKGHGLTVFQGFGSFIKRFGMTFEISESQLSHPPAKKDLDCLLSYHGPYPWPSPNYARFEDRARLERTADEISLMKAAFSHLSAVQELALSVDSGLGWLNGPDKSIRSLVLNNPSPVFGRSFYSQDRKTKDSVDFWNAIQDSQWRFGFGSGVKDFYFGYRELFTAPEEFDGLHGTQYADTSLWPAVDGAVLLQNEMLPERSGSIFRFGVLYTATNRGVPSKPAKPRLMPNKLSKEQTEWLLETQWAQRAFLESYVLAVVDNPSTFANVTTLLLAKMSSQLLTTMLHPPFWKSLPSLRDVTLRVKPDWRTVEKDAAGVAQTSAINPTDALSTFQGLLRCFLANIKTLKSLNVGWIGGGELAEGVFARNRHLLPAPICHLSEVFSTTCNDPLIFNHVQHLTLTNCWITPGMLTGIVKNHAGKNLKKLTLNYVSLTALPRSTANAPQAPIHHGAPNPPPPVVMPHGAHFPVAPAVNLPNLFPQAGNINVMNTAGNAAPGFPGFGPPAGLGLGQGLVQVSESLAGQLLLQTTKFFFSQGLINPQHFQHLPILPGVLHNHAQHGALHQMMLPPLPPMTLPFPQLVMPPMPAPPFPPVLGGPPPAPSPNNPPSQTDPFTDCRPGSWPAIIDVISPGPVLADYRSTPQKWERNARKPRPRTALETLEFNSCGYVHFASDPTLDQSIFDAWIHAQAHIPTSYFFRMKVQTLEDYMMRGGPVRDRFCGTVVQHIPAREWATLRHAWGLWEGWEDKEEANAVTYDGGLLGGTGRFSGIVWKGQPLIPTLPF